MTYGLVNSATTPQSPSNQSIERIAAGFGLLEAARWHSTLGLLFSDMTRGGVYRLDDSGSPQVVIAHRKGIGGMAPHATGGVIVAGRNVAHKNLDDGTTTVLLHTAPGETFFNDMTADGRGRLYVGSVAGDPLAADHVPSAGRLYRIDIDGTSSVLADDLLLTNGMAITPDDSTLYHVDTERNVIWAYDLTSDAPTRRVHIDTSGCEGAPDGIALDADGTVWVAMAGGGAVVAWDRDGEQVMRVTLPQPLVTSVAFGGPDLGTLFVTTGATDEADEIGGAVYATPASAAGVPTRVAKVDLLTVG
jgi:D-xylonolactonase